MDFNVSHADEFVSLEKGPVGNNTDTWIVVGDQTWLGGAVGDFFSVRAESFVPFPGTLGGGAVVEFYLYWSDVEGVASTNFSLPRNLGDFQDYEGARFWGYTEDFPGLFEGDITGLSQVPLPAAFWLFLSGLVTPFAFRFRRALN